MTIKIWHHESQYTVHSTKTPLCIYDSFIVIHLSLRFFACYASFLSFSCIFPNKFLYLRTKQKMNKMTAIDLRANTMQILDQFDKADASLWQKVLDAVTLIYKGEEKTLHTKRAEQKAKIRQMVGILNEDSLEDWKREKEEYLTEKYQ